MPSPERHRSPEPALPHEPDELSAAENSLPSLPESGHLQQSGLARLWEYRRHVKVLSAGILSQAFSSSTNFIFTFALARQATAIEFAAVALALTFYTALIALTDAGLNQPLALLYHEAHPGHRAQIVRDGLGAALICMLPLVGFVTLIAVLPLPAGSSKYMLPLAVLTPGLLLNEWMRNYFFTTLRPAGACLMDIAWLLMLLVFVIFFSNKFHSHSTMATFLAWGSSGGAVALGSLAVKRLIPSLPNSIHFIRSGWSITRVLLAEASLVAFQLPLLMLILSCEAGLSAVGALRGGLTLLSPLTIFSAGVDLLLFPRLAVAAKHRNCSFDQMLRVYWVGMFAVTGLVSAAVLAIPDRVGTDLLGPTWAGAKSVLPWMIVVVLARAIASVPHYRLLLPRPSKYLVVARGQDTIIALVVGAIGGTFGHTGAASGFALGKLLGAGGWLFTRRWSRRHEPPEAKPQPRSPIGKRQTNGG